MCWAGIKIRVQVRIRVRVLVQPPDSGKVTLVPRAVGIVLLIGSDTAAAIPFAMVGAISSTAIGTPGPIPPTRVTVTVRVTLDCF